MILFNKPKTVHLQPVLHDMRHVSWGATLMDDEASTACMAVNDDHFEHLYAHLGTKKPAIFRITHILLQKTSNML